MQKAYMSPCVFPRALHGSTNICNVLRAKWLCATRDSSCVNTAQWTHECITANAKNRRKINNTKNEQTPCNCYGRSHRWPIDGCGDFRSHKMRVQNENDANETREKKSRTPASKMEKIMCAAHTSQQMGFDERTKKATWRAIVCNALSMVANASKNDGRRAMTADEIDSTHTHAEHSENNAGDSFVCDAFWKMPDIFRK